MRSAGPIFLMVAVLAGFGAGRASKGAPILGPALVDPVERKPEIAPPRLPIRRGNNAFHPRIQSKREAAGGVVNVVAGDAPSRGPANAKVTIVEWSDFQ